MRALYVGQIHDLDGQLQEFVSRIATNERAEDTLVVLTSDHGERFSEEKVGHGGLHNDVLRVPLGFYWPARIPAREHRRVVELVDVMPTILDFAGMPSDGLDGQSLAPLLLAGEATSEAPDAALSLDSEFRYAIQDERFKLIRAHDGGQDRLHDLARDPKEIRDVAASHPSEMERLRALLDDRLASQDDQPLPAASQEEIDDVTR